eukprot:4222744-Prymnesium_polylepis.1
MAPVKLDCKEDLERQKGDARHVSDHSKALKVLKDIAAKAGLAVSQIAYTVDAPPGSKAKAQGQADHRAQQLPPRHHAALQGGRRRERGIGRPIRQAGEG